MGDTIWSSLQDIDLASIVGLTLSINLSATVIGLVIGLPLGAWLAIGNEFYRRFGALCFETLLGLPPLIAGLVVYLLLSYKGPFASWQWLYTPRAMIMAQSLLVIPIVTALTRRIIGNLWQYYKDDLTVLGVPRWRAIPTLLYEARFSLIPVGLTGFGRALGEVGAVLVVGGNIEGSTRVLTTAIALETAQGETDRALALGLLLVCLALLVTVIVGLVRRFGIRHQGLGEIYG